MKKNLCALLALILIVSLAFPLTAGAVTEDAQNQSYSCYSLDATESVLGPSLITDNADSVVIYELNSNTMMYTLNPDEVIEPASLVKTLKIIPVTLNMPKLSVLTILPQALFV